MDSSTKSLETKQDLQKKAWELHNTIKTHSKNSKTSFIKTMYALKIMRDEKLYNYLGTGGYDTFEQYLQEPDLELGSPITIKKYLAMLNYLQETLSLGDAEIEKVPIYQVSQYFSEIKKKSVDEARELVSQLSHATPHDRKQILHDANIFLPKPTLYRDYATGKWIIEFSPEFTLKIYNQKEQIVIFD